jgi:hypothetical protein
MKELPEDWNESIVLHIYKKGDKIYCINYRGISLLPTTYKILSKILRSMLTPCAKEITGNHKFGLTNNNIFFIRQILEKKCKKMKQCISYL